MKLGLFGFGHLGKIHYKCLQDTRFNLAGIYDPALLSKDQHEGIKIFKNQLELIRNSDACVVASTTATHYQLATEIISQGKHCFIEKPMTTTLQEAEELESLAKDNSTLITQVGFVERYNPAFLFVQNKINNPKFIEIHRLAQFNNRGNDVSVVFDLMIHDLDLLLNIKKCDIADIKATGVKVITDSLDICNARIEFEDGSVANITASRMSLKSMRKFRIFQNEGYISLDLSKKESQFIKLSEQQSENSIPINIGEKAKHLTMTSSGILEGNAILSELIDFYNSIENNVQSKANFTNALRTTKLAHSIEQIALNH